MLRRTRAGHFKTGHRADVLRGLVHAFDHSAAGDGRAGQCLNLASVLGQGNRHGLSGKLCLEFRLFCPRAESGRFRKIGSAHADPADRAVRLGGDRRFNFPAKALGQSCCGISDDVAVFVLSNGDAAVRLLKIGRIRHQCAERCHSLPTRIFRNDVFRHQIGRRQQHGRNHADHRQYQPSGKLVSHGSSSISPTARCRTDFMASYRMYILD